MKKIIVLMAFGLLVGILPMSAQDSASDTTMTTTSTTSIPRSNDNIIGLVAGAVAIVALGVVILYMYRNRRTSIGGIQNQSKPDPQPRTTQSINNPGSGV